MRVSLKPFWVGLFGAVLAVSQASAAELPAAWMTDKRTGCKVWNPHPAAGETVRWSGACVGGFGSGPGITEWLVKGEVTERMDGSRVAGHLQGRGVLTLPNGDKFEGMWKDDRRNGPGTFIGTDGTRMSGVWIDDRLVGERPKPL